MTAENTLKRSIMDMASGAIKERVDIEMGKVLANIMDENTKPEFKRKVTVTLEFSPKEDRQRVEVEAIVRSSLAPLRAVGTSLHLGHDTEGAPMAVEAKADIPGQGSLFDENKVVELNVVNN